MANQTRRRNSISIFNLSHTPLQARASGHVKRSIHGYMDLDTWIWIHARWLMLARSMSRYRSCLFRRHELRREGRHGFHRLIN